MIYRTLFKIVPLLAMVASLCPGQSTVGQILGTVADSSKAAISGASVTITNEQTNDSRKATTDPSGNFIFPQLPVGRYTLTVEAAGFQRFVDTGIDLKVDDRRREDVAMRVGQVNEQVTVQASATAVNADNATIGDVIAQTPINELPLNGRNFLQLAQLTPGTIPPVLQNNQDTTSGTNGNRTNLSVAVSGTREVSAEYLFDGVLGREEFYGAVSIQPPLESIEEFKIMRGYFSPEYGSPAIISVATKSGTNAFHGALWEFLRNDILDARNTFDFGAHKPPFRQNQFGGSFGGPIRKDKLFFQVDTELLRARQSFTENLLLPTQSMLQGNFSGFPTIYDPTTANAGQIKQPFPNNIIPATRFSSFTQKYNSYILTSPVSPLSPSVVANGFNYTGSQETSTNDNKWDVRMDYYLSSKDRIFGRMDYDQTDETIINPQPGANRIYPLHSRLAVLSWSRVFSPSWVNEARVGLDRAFIQAGGPVPGTNPDWPAFFGLQNISTVKECSGVPTLNLSQYGTAGFPSTSCIDSTNNNIPFFDNVSFVKGRHNITFGGEIERINLRELVAFGPEGSFTFSGQFTSGFTGTNVIPNTGNSIGDYLLGFPSQGNAQALVTPTYRRGWFYALYFNDDFKVSKTFTLNLGLRWQAEPPLIEKYNNISDFNFSTGQQEFAGKNGVPRGLYSADLHDFAPRVGLAWRPFGLSDTAIRASYGIFFDRLPGNDQAWQGLSPPLNVAQSFTSPNPVIPSVNIANLFPVPLFSSTLPTGTALFNLGGRSDPYLQQWTFSIEQKLPWNLFLETAYVGSRGNKLSKRYDRNIASAPPAPGDTRTVQQRRPYPTLGYILSDEGAGMSKYNAWQTSLRKSLSSGLTFMANYMWGRSMDTDSYDSSATRHYRNGDNDYGRSIFDARQRFVLSVNYEVPFGKGAHGFMKQVLAGWELNSITTLQTGLPFYVTSTDYSNTGTTFGGRPNRICNGNLPSGQRTAHEWFDTACFVQAPLNTYGDGGVFYLDTDGFKGEDIGVFKNFQILETRRLQFRYEAFNLFNFTNYNLPGNNVSSPTTFGKITSAQPARIMQFALKFVF
jgi:hypothetical protein